MEDLSLFVTYKACDENQFVLIHENEEMEIPFFNLLFYDETKRLQACEYLKKANVIELEEEKYSESGYYIFTDGKLFQKIAIDNKWARVNMNYDGYAYDLTEEEVITSAIPQPINQENSSYLVLAVLLLCSAICILITKKL